VNGGSTSSSAREGAPRWVLSCALLLAVLVPDGAAWAAPRVLMLNSFGRDFGPFEVVSAELRTELARISREPFELLDVALDTAFFAEPSADDPVLHYINAIHAERPVQLLVTIGSPAALFVQRFRSRILPGVPVLYVGVERRLLKPGAVAAGDAAIPIAVDLKGTVQSMLDLLPRTRRVFVVIGSTPLERFWLAEIEREVATLGARVTLTSSVDMSFDEVLARAPHLGPDTAILYTLMLRDGAGVPYTQERALSRLSATASAPIFGLFDYQLGKGIVGGRLASIEELSRRAARTMAAMLAGQPVAAVPEGTLVPGAPVYDWRELARWGINEADLPPGSEIRFRQPTPWQAYAGWILSGVAALILEGLLILVLVTNYLVRRQAERRLRESEARLALATADIGIWEWDITSGEVWGNERWHGMFGFADDGKLGFDRVLERIDPDDRSGVRSALEKALAGGTECRAEFWIALPDGVRRWISARGRPDAGGGAGRRMLGASIDITERRQAEDAARTLSRRLIQAQEQERARLARELHDDVTQRLARLSIDSARVEQALPGGDARDTARALQAGLINLCEDVHGLSYQLHPSMVDDLGLAEALRVEWERLPQQGIEPEGLRFRDLPEAIPPDASLCLFRIAQEALRNVMRHAPGCRVSMALEGVDDGLQLVVHDTGPGFDLKAPARQATLGLASMRERVSLLGGDFEVDSAPGAGTTVLAWVPLAGTRS
jgi:PAS domain S-box-containing protein